MSKQGWLKREIETVQREVATWPAWKRGEGMDDVKRYKLSQDARYGDGAFVIPAGQVMVREADYDALREQNRVLREALQIAIQRLNEGMHGKYDTLFAHGGDPGIVALCKSALTATSQPGGEG